jgi:hypothetical protein
MARALAQRVSTSAAEAEAWVEIGRQRAIALCYESGFTRLIERLADALLERGRFGRAELDRIVETTEDWAPGGSLSSALSAVLPGAPPFTKYSKGCRHAWLEKVLRPLRKGVDA